MTEYTKDSLIKEILEIILSHCNEANQVQSFFGIGIDLEKLGLTSTKTRTDEWNKKTRKKHD